MSSVAATRRLEVPPREPRQAVLERDRLALLGELEPAVDRVRRLREDRRVRRAAAPPRATAPAVEDRQLDAALARQPGELLLGAEDLPLGGDDAAVLPRVRVADHHLEPLARRPVEQLLARARAAPRRSSIVSSSGTTVDARARPRRRAPPPRARPRRSGSSRRSACRCTARRAARWSARRLGEHGADAVGVLRGASASGDGGRAPARGGRRRRAAAAAPASPPSAIRCAAVGAEARLHEVELGAAAPRRPRIRRRRAAPRSRSAAAGTARSGFASSGRSTAATAASASTSVARHAPRHGERANVAAKQLAHERARRARPPRARSPARVRVAVEVAADPACRTGAARRAAAPPGRRQVAGAASHRLSSRNQSPCRISSTTRGRSERTSSVCQRIVTSSASDALRRARSAGSAADRRARRAAPRSAGASRGSSAAAPRSGARSARARRDTRRGRARSPPSPTPAVGQQRRAPRRATRAACRPRARSRAGGATRWCCSAMFARWK